MSLAGGHRGASKCWPAPRWPGERAAEPCEECLCSFWVQAAYVHQQHADQAAAAKPALPDSLTSRELEILALIASGLTNSEIAARLFISPLTCKSHVSRTLTKLDAGTGLS